MQARVVRHWGCATVVAIAVLVGRAAGAQQPDTTPPPKVVLPSVTVSVTRTSLPLARTPLSIEMLGRDQIARARPTWGLDEALAAVPGVYAANRYNFSLDQRLSIRGFGARSAFAVRGIKVLLDGIPQTLPDGQGQLTNVDLDAVDRIEVLRGPASALFGNATGGVISIWTDPTAPAGVSESARVVAGRFDRNDAGWSKWRSTTGLRLGAGSGAITVSRLDYTGEREHSAADLRNLNARVQFPISEGGGWRLTALTDVGDDPRADNPGALTLAELRANRDSAAAINITRHAGKDVSQVQSGVTLQHSGADGREATVTVYGVSRDLKNPQTFAYIDVNRVDYGVRTAVTVPLALASMRQRLTAGLDFQRQRDDRKNFAYRPGTPLPDTSRLLDQLEHVTELGPFVQSVVELTPGTTVTGGLRYDWVSFQVDDRLPPDDSGRRLMQALSGSLGIAATPSDAVTVYANVSSSFETPTTTELANRPDTAGGFNPILQPQKAWNYELGMRGSSGGAGRARWSAAVFQADVRDELISYEVPSSPQRRFFRNAGTSRHRGIELGGEIEMAAGLDLGMTYTYADYHYVHYRFSPDTAHSFVLDGRALPGIPRSWLHLRLRAAPSFAAGGWCELETTYSSDVPVDDTLNTRTSPWWDTNLRLGWEGTAGGWRLSPFLGVNNVFNRLYVGSVVINAAGGRYYEPAAGRNLYVGLSLGAGR